MTVIEASLLGKSFNSRRVLGAIDLSIERGSVVGLLGTNGSGKSTLIKCLLGLLKPETGISRIFGEDSWNLSAETKARIGYVPQKPNFYPWMLPLDIINYFGAFYDNWDQAWARELVSRWELPTDSKASELSPGEKQRLSMVLALGHHPELLVLDEPVASLDPIGRRESLRQLLEVTQDGQHTILYSTHILSDLERIASHVAILSNGTISCFEELDDLKDNVKRLRISSSRTLPSTFTVPQSLQLTRSEKSAIATVPHVTEELIDELKERWDCDVAVEDLNLEEIFLELSASEGRR